MVTRRVVVLPNLVFSKQTINSLKIPFHRIVKDKGEVNKIKIPKTVYNYDKLFIWNFGTRRRIIPSQLYKYKDVYWMNNNLKGISSSINKNSHEMIVASEKYGLKLFSSLDEAVGEIGYPLIAKPLNGYQSRGIIMLPDDSYRSFLSDDYVFQRYIPFKERACEYRVILGKHGIINSTKRIYKEELFRKGEREPWEYESLGDSPSLPPELIDDCYEILKLFQLDVLAIDWISVKKKFKDKYNDRKYIFSEVNTAFGVGEYTARRINDYISNLVGE